MRPQMEDSLRHLLELPALPGVVTIGEASDRWGLGRGAVRTRQIRCRLTVLPLSKDCAGESPMRLRGVHGDLRDEASPVVV